MADRPARVPNPLSTAGLDRFGLLRKDPARVAEVLATTEVRVVGLCGGKVWVQGDPPVPADPPVDDLEDAWLLGGCDGVTFVAKLVEPEVMRDEGARLAGLREVAALLPPLEANVLAMATGMAVWHATHKHCGQCGAETVVDWAGHRRYCAGCPREHFPRTDPAVIVLVTHGDRALLGRNPSWPRGFASVLAGFVEPGESLEDAVVREVKEEAGIDVSPDAVEYQSSQPWPFPASIMLGFTAEATTDELHPDPEELADAYWYTRDELAHGAVNLPPSLSISRRLVDEWLARGSTA